MTYKAVVDFKDLRDGGYEYKAGDKYPHSGVADPERAYHLMTPTTQRGPLIEEVVEEAVEEAVEATAEEAAEEVVKETVKEAKSASKKK